MNKNIPKKELLEILKIVLFQSGYEYEKIIQQKEKINLKKIENNINEI
ncbi:MAG: hypothetical protein UR27_C0001G0069 [Candidatus Peregrinibacteria bacterium GW2011_GWA2_33_10]|nr:MAG: hypothetical protein UR27_C0001G0069 [Candidatus Peregrinibacteria bacterium GW2011_GWA2_33_10]KKP39798.1 MAG: hypothetical protein UR30_C0008G0067 [Candidatus Peregrinibacteria bacterium GW2011_GWC2_33_13]